jgi:hypothetical protein
MPGTESEACDSCAERSDSQVGLSIGDFLVKGQTQERLRRLGILGDRSQIELFSQRRWVFLPSRPAGCPSEWVAFRRCDLSPSCRPAPLRCCQHCTQRGLSGPPFRFAIGRHSQTL